MIPEPQQASCSHAPVQHDGLESSSERKKRWLSLGCAYFIIFTINAQETIFRPSLWSYISELDSTVPITFFGIVVAIYYVASGITAPLYGLWSNKINKVKNPMIFGICSTAIGNIIFYTAELFPGNRRWVIFTAQVFLGIGYGAYSCFYTYVVMASTKQERSKAMSMLTCCLFLASSLGPGFQAALSAMKPDSTLQKALINMFTIAALSNLGLCIVDVLILIFLFKEYWINNEQKNNFRINQSAGYDKVAAFVCCISRAGATFLWGLNNTVLSEFSIIMFNWSYGISVRYNGVIQGLGGLLQVGACIFVGFVGNRCLRTRNLILIGLLSLLAFYMSTYSWPGTPALSTTIRAENKANAHNQSIHHWTSWTPTIQLRQYICGWIFLAIGSATALTSINTLYSNIVGQGKTGIEMGVFHCHRNVAQAIGPAISGSIFYYFGPIPTWLLAEAVILACIILVLITYKRLVPTETVPMPDENTHLLSEVNLRHRSINEEPLTTSAF